MLLKKISNDQKVHRTKAAVKYMEVERPLKYNKDNKAGIKVKGI